MHTTPFPLSTMGPMGPMGPSSRVARSPAGLPSCAGAGRRGPRRFGFRAPRRFVFCAQRHRVLPVARREPRRGQVRAAPVQWLKQATTLPPPALSSHARRGGPPALPLSPPCPHPAQLPERGWSTGGVLPRGCDVMHSLHVQRVMGNYTRPGAEGPQLSSYHAGVRAPLCVTV